MPEPTHVMEVLERQRCLELLATAPIGRLAVSVNGQPEVFPVNFALDGDRVVIRTSEGTKLRAADLDLVAFEADGNDEATGEWWSVVVKGTGREITDALDLASERERALPVFPLANDDAGHWIRILPHQVSGRLLRPRQAGSR